MVKPITKQEYEKLWRQKDCSLCRKPMLLGQDCNQHSHNDCWETAQNMIIEEPYNENEEDENS